MPGQEWEMWGGGGKKTCLVCKLSNAAERFLPQLYGVSLLLLVLPAGSHDSEVCLTNSAVLHPGKECKQCGIQSGNQLSSEQEMCSQGSR